MQSEKEIHMCLLLSVILPLRDDEHLWHAKLLQFPSCTDIKIIIINTDELNTNQNIANLDENCACHCIVGYVCVYVSLK